MAQRRTTEHDLAQVPSASAAVTTTTGKKSEGEDAMDVGRVAKEDDRRPARPYVSRAESRDKETRTSQPTGPTWRAPCFDLSKPLESSSSIVFAGGE